MKKKIMNKHDHDNVYSIDHDIIPKTEKTKNNLS